MVTHSVDEISFQMRKTYDFSFLSKYGKAFCVFDQNDSGNISFGVDNGKEKYFVKIAGAETSRTCTTTHKAIDNLKAAIAVYVDLSHNNLISLLEHFTHGDFYVAVFKWSAGDCLFDYWNFEKYSKSGELRPKDKFKKLAPEKKLRAFDVIFDFLVFTESKNYVAVDFYDGSIMYDFEMENTTICDIDFFRKSPTVNDMGEEFWGTKRLKSPEEYIYGAKIDAVTNVFTLGALLFHFFGSYTEKEIETIYKENAFSPSRYETWELNEAQYLTAMKAVNPDRANRYSSMSEFYEVWKANQSLQISKQWI